MGVELGFYLDEFVCVVIKLDTEPAPHLEFGFAAVMEPAYEIAGDPEQPRNGPLIRSRETV